MITESPIEAQDLDANLLRELAGEHGALRLTLYLPLEKGANESDQNRTRLKDGLTKAEAMLREQGMENDSIGEWLAPLREMYENPGSLLSKKHTLAFFIGPQQQRLIQTNLEAPSLVHVGSRYYIKPLLPALKTDAEFFVAALAQDNVRFFEGDRTGLTEVDVPGMPEDRDEATWADNPEESLQYHVGATIAREGGPGSVPEERQHGQGSNKDKLGSQRERTSATVARAVSHYVSNKRGAVVCIGTEKNVGEFLKAADFHGNPHFKILRDSGHLSPDDLHSAALEQVKGLLKEERETLDDRLNSAPPELVLRSPEEAAIAACNGRLDFAIIADDFRQEAVVEPEEARVRELADGESGATCVHDLADTIAQETLAHGGRVDLRSRDKVPGGSAVAALARYPIK